MTIAVDKVAQLHVPIDPVGGDVARPFWSVMIPAFERTDFLRQTIESVLAQDPGPEMMQIEVVDNCSRSSATEDLVREVSGGRVSFYRQLRNVGMVNNWNTCIQRSRGQWVHILHDDDYVRAGFYEKLQKACSARPEIGAAFCRFQVVDELGECTHTNRVERETAGVLDKWIYQIARKQWISTPSIAVKRSTYEKLGGFETIVPGPSDWEMWVRIAAYFPVWYEPEILACYRAHSKSTTSDISRSGANTAQMRMAIQLVNMYLPEGQAKYLMKAALRNYARDAFTLARRYVAQNDWTAARAQIREGLKCSRSPGSLAWLTRLMVAAMLKRLVGRR